MIRLALLCLLAATSAMAAPRTAVKLSNEPVTPNPGPTAIVHLGKGFKSSGPLNLIVHFHGIMNCVSVTVEARPGRCKVGGVSQAHNLIAQVDASNVNAAFVALEMAHNRNDTNPGKLVQDGFFAKVVEELLPHIGKLARRSYTTEDLGKVVLTSHSGGYAAVCETLAHAGMPISAVVLFDSLYPNPKKKGPKEDQCFNKYLAFARDNSSDGRFGIVYTAQGGTLANSQAMADQVKKVVPGTDFWDERRKPDAQWTKAAELRRRFVFVKTGVGHDDSVRKHYATMLGKLGL